MRLALLRLAVAALTLSSLGACVSLGDEVPSRLERPVPGPIRPAPPAPAEDPPEPAPAAERTASAIPGAPAPSVLIPATPPAPAYSDLMDRIRAGFQLPDDERKAIDVQLAWFSRNPEYLDRVFGRAALYMHHIVEEVERRGMPMELALLPVIESAFEPFAYSRARASGLWQFIPGTGNRFGLPQTWWYDGRRDVTESTRAALDYLQFLHDEFQGDWLLAVAGYNCGENCIARAIARNQAAGKPTSFWDLRLPNETRAYVPKLLAMKRLVADPAALGLEFSPIPDEPYFTKVEIGNQIDLKLAAELAGLTHDELFELNPAYHRWATPPQGPHSLLLPIDSAELFKQNLSLLTPDELMRVTHHVAQAGETLPELATRYGTNVMTIRMLNDLSEDASIEGLDLRVPSGTTQLPDKVLRAAAIVDGPTRSARGGRNRPGIHIVRRGESIWTIARRNNLDPRTLMRLNGKRTTDKIMPGERLVLSSSAGARGGSARRSDASDSSASDGGGDTITHRVKSGETLFAIARRYGVTVGQLTSWNGIPATRILRVGQRLTIRTTGR